MNVVLLTTASIQFGSALIESYKVHGGPQFSAVLIVPNRRDLGFPVYAWPLVAAKMLGVGGVLAHLASHGIGFVPAKWRGMGLERSWSEAYRSVSRSVTLIHAANSEEGKQALVVAAPDVLVSIGVPQVLSKAVLAIPRLGSMNVHHGLLPRYRGHFATFWEVFEHQSEYGVTVHVMAPRVDDGRILHRTLFRWDEADSFADLMIKKKWTAGEMLADAVNEAVAADEVLVHSAPNGSPQPVLPAYSFPSVADLRQWSWRQRSPQNPVTPRR